MGVCRKRTGAHAGTGGMVRRHNNSPEGARFQVKKWQEEIAGGRKIIGIWQQIPVPMMSRFLAQLGWDWIVLDMQHGCYNWETAYECIHVIRAAGARPLVRIAIGEPFEVRKALDLGAGGVIVPMVNTREEAARMA